MTDDDVNEISPVPRNGYSWFNTGPTKAVAAFDQWAAARRKQPAM